MARRTCTGHAHGNQNPYQVPTETHVEKHAAVLVEPERDIGGFESPASHARAAVFGRVGCHAPRCTATKQHCENRDPASTEMYAQAFGLQPDMCAQMHPGERVGLPSRCSLGDRHAAVRPAPAPGRGPTS
eukprot:262686-Chlamydomonas_euryale.AAC.14